MAIVMKNSEVKKFEAHLHWSSLLFPGIWAGFFSLSILGQLFGGKAEGAMIFWSVVIGYLPLAYRLLQNKCKQYVVTNERLYVEEGILSKAKKDVPLHKINDLGVSQSLLQRIFGAGNISVLTGNDKPTVLKHIETPDEFKNALSDAVAAISKK